ncbi:hypothetical protein H1R20_g1683, partial [Candolleomyces eurysporus]
MARWTFTRFAASQWTSAASATKADLTDKVVVVVGASSGIGLEAAKHFAGMNPKKLVLACRNEERANRALTGESCVKSFSRWVQKSRWSTLAQFASVIDFAKKFNEKEDRLDILVQNAGVLPEMEYTATEDGWETTYAFLSPHDRPSHSADSLFQCRLQVNHVALSLLGILLLPKMISTAERFGGHPRMVFVGSEVHLLAKFEKHLVEGDRPLKTFGSKEHCTPEVLQKRYNDTKLLALLFVRALSERLPSPSISPSSPPSSSPSVIVTCINPGFCYSDLRNKPNNMQVSSNALDGFVNWAREKMFAKTAEEGSRQILFAALAGSGDDEVESKAEKEGNSKEKGKEEECMSIDKLRGAYISNCKVAEPSDYVIGEEGREAQEKLWVDLVKELTLVEPQVQEITTRYLTEPVNLE